MVEQINTVTKLTDYQIIKGTARDVEEGVTALIEKGYTLNGPMYPYVPSSSSSQTLFAQCVVLYETRFI